MKKSMHHYLLKSLRRGRVYKSLLRDELRHGRKDYSWFRRISYLAKGFNSDKSYLYECGSKELARYLSDVEVNKVRKFNRIHGILLDKKDIFHNLMSRLGVGPELHGVFSEGHFYRRGDKVALGLNEAIGKIQDGSTVRPIDTCFTHGAFYRVSNDNGKKVLVNEVGELHIENAMKHGIWNVFDALATREDAFVRITSFRNESGEVNILYAIQQIGLKSPVYCLVDIGSGILRDGVKIDREQYKKTRVVYYPGTGDRVKGCLVRNWQAAKEIVLYTHRALPNINAATWYLVPTESGWLILDASNKLDTVLHQTLSCFEMT
jgi:hypothetical protein